ncbi:MAG: response regulator transcription factor, partial [Syntrophales bacterium]|nr:response regulator transcription factor [Syntrophales bacterium]
TKPFSVRELVARVKAVLRRSGTKKTAEGEEQPFHYRDLSINYASYDVRLGGKKIDLGITETKLLFFLSRHPGRVYTREQLLETIWGDETFVEPRTVDVHISRLRAAIEKDKENPSYIITVRGVGYKFADLQS